MSALFSSYEGCSIPLHEQQRHGGIHMRHLVRKFLVTAAILATLSAPAATFALERMETVDAGKTSPMWDLAFLRPVGFAGLVASTVVWVPMQAVVMVTRPTEWKMPIDMMLKDPFEFVFVDPLGSH
ncbi:MAG: hypothetical protein GY937_29310 [bacterium]|nr:hypothetical protein [bacterium]